jgi:hypothetical protein
MPLVLRDFPLVILRLNPKNDFFAEFWIIYGNFTGTSRIKSIF